MVCLSCLVVRFSYNCLNHEKILFLFPLYLVHELPAALFYPFNILDFSLAHVQSWINRPASLSMGLKGLLSTLIPVLQYMCVHVLGFHCAEVLYANIISTLILVLLILQMSASSLGHWILCLDSLGALRLLKELYLGFLVYNWVSSGFTCLQFISLILFFSVWTVLRSPRVPKACLKTRAFNLSTRLTQSLGNQFSSSLLVCQDRSNST